MSSPLGVGEAESSDHAGAKAACDLPKVENSLNCKKLTILGAFVFVLFPLAVLLIAALYAGLFACFRHATYLEGFLYVASNLLGIANPLTDWAPGGSEWAEWEVAIAVVLDVYVALTGLVCFGIMLNVVNIFQVPLAINRVVERHVTRNAVLVPMIALGIVVPICYTTLCAILGALLSLAEEWSFKEGFLYVLSNALQLAAPFTDVMPDTVGGRLLDIVISSVAMGYIALFADYVVTLNPSKSVRRKFRGCLGALGAIDLGASPALHPLDPENNRGNDGPRDCVCVGVVASGYWEQNDSESSSSVDNRDRETTKGQIKVQKIRTDD
ncbi:hypothetical protein ACHAWF_003024 [Thalassiosira exigua]